MHTVCVNLQNLRKSRKMHIEQTTPKIIIENTVFATVANKQMGGYHNHCVVMHMVMHNAHVKSKSSYMYHICLNSNSNGSSMEPTNGTDNKNVKVNGRYGNCVRQYNTNNPKCCKRIGSNEIIYIRGAHSSFHII